MENKPYIGIRIPADLKDRLDTVCSEQERSMTSVCKIFLEKGVDTYDPNNFLPQADKKHIIKNLSS
jgi:predicted DNA-binding protein